MPTSATLIDDFDDNSLDVAKWTQTNNAGVVGSETAQTYRFAVAATAVAFSDITSAASFDLTGSHHTVELVDAGVQQEGLEAYFTVRADANNRLFVVVANGFLGVYKVVAGTQTSLTFPTYDPVAHRWLRIRESSGTTFWEASANGTSWSVLHSEANPIPVTSVQLVLQAGAWQQLGNAKTVIYDNVGGSTGGLAPTGVASAEVFGTPTVTPGAVTVSPTGIGSAEAFVAPTASPGPVTVSPSGVTSAEAFGNPSITFGLNVEPTGVGSQEAFGAAKLARISRGSMTIPVRSGPDGTPGVRSASATGLRDRSTATTSLAEYSTTTAREG